MIITIKNVLKKSLFLRKKLITPVSKNRETKNSNIKKYKLFPRIMSISPILVFRKSTNGNKNTIKTKEIYEKFFLIFINLK